MSSYGFLLLCIQACLVQLAFSTSPAYWPHGYRTHYGAANADARANNKVEIDIDIINKADARANSLGGLYDVGPVGYGYGGARSAASASASAAAAAAARAGAAAGAGAIGLGSGYGAFGGEGEGELKVAGTIGASGSSTVEGRVPVIGSVSFGGALPASGSAHLSGNCGCAHLV